MRLLLSFGNGSCLVQRRPAHGSANSVSPLRIRRALGFKLERAEKLLALYLTYLAQAGQDRLTLENALAWARMPGAGGGSWWAQRFSVVHCFATCLHALDLAHEIPPPDILVGQPRRAVPIPLHRARDLGVDGSDRPPPRPAASSDLSHVGRAAGRHPGCWLAKRPASTEQMSTSPPA